MATLKERLAAAKAKAPPAAEKPKGIRITPTDPKEAPAAPPERPEPRELGRSTPGEDIPFGTRPEEEPAASWHEVRTALDTDLAIWIDGEHGWLAVRSRNGQPGLILLQRLPLMTNPRNGNEPY